MVDVIVCNWVGLVTENEAGPYGFGYTVVDKAASLYTDNSMFASTNPVLLQWRFHVLIQLFEWIWPRMNMESTMEMVCYSGLIYGQHSITVYEWRMTGEGDPYR